MSAWISVMGLFEYDNSVFDDFAIPEQLDRGILVEEIMARFAELEVVYPNPVTFKQTLKNWSNMRLPVWKHLYDTTMYKYEPLNNYNMESIGKVTGNIEDSTRDDLIANRQEKEKIGKNEHISADENANGDEKGNEKELTKGNDAVKSVEQDNNYVYGFNSTDKALRNSEEDNVNSTDEWNTDKNTNDARDWRRNQGNRQDKTNDENRELDRWDKSGRLVENIVDSVKDSVDNREGLTGIYSRQMLIQQEREVAEFSIYEYIIRDFKRRFCIQVW